MTPAEALALYAPPAIMGGLVILFSLGVIVGRLVTR